MSLANSKVNDFVKELFVAAGLILKSGSNGIRIITKEEGTTIGTGATLALAVNNAFSFFPKEAGANAQALYYAAALSFGPEELFQANEDLWGDDEDDEDDGDEDSEDVEHEEGTIHFTRE